MIPILLSLSAFIFLVFAFLKHPKFGKLPSGERLERIKHSPNYRDGIFQNLHPTPQITNEASYPKILRDNFSAKNKRPKSRIPSQKINLHELSPGEDVLVWFGHSSYFMQIDGKKILVDPVFSGSASPFSFMIKAFDGADIYSAEDMPEVDYLIITHDHWDHLDYKTVRKLRAKVGKVITGLGVGQALEYWGFDSENIIENDWYESVDLENGFKITTTPARHFSGRSLQAKQTLWSSFVLQTPTLRIFIGGDGGYDTHFAEIGERFGGFDLVILENGQYNTNWKYIHMMPEQVLLAAKDLGAKRVLPVHSSKFALANHPWDEPLNRITAANVEAGLSLLTPMIGEKVELKNELQEFSRWWENIE